MRKLLCLLLAMAMLLCVFAGCAKTEEPAAPAAETPAAEAAAPAAQEPAPAAPAAEPAAPEAEEPAPEAPAAEPAAPEAPPVEAPEGPAPEAGPGPEAPPPEEPAPEPEPVQGFSYPLDSNETITGWFACFSFMGVYRENMEYNNMLLTPYVEEAIGVDFDYTTCSDMVASEQFQLMIASGDWPDYSSTVQGYYSGGLVQAYADEVIMELEPELLQENAPLYYNQLSQIAPEDVAYTLDDGMYLAMYSIRDGKQLDQALVTRADWYEQYGGDVHDLQSFTDYLYAIHDGTGCENSINAESGGALVGLNDAFGVTIPAYNARDLPIYVDGDKVYTSLTADGYYDYIQWFNGLLNDGLVYPEFYSRTMAYVRSVDILADNMGVWQGNSNSGIELTMNDGHVTATYAIPQITDGDGVDNWGTYSSSIGGGYSVFADCAYPELVLQACDYFWTDNGYIMGNYGVEGETFYYDENGDIRFTELITNDVAGQGAENAIKGYMDELWPMLIDNDRIEVTFTESQTAAVNVWKSFVYETNHSYPQAAALTTDEQDSITNDVSDIMTTASTTLLSFFTGNTPLTPEAWEAYVATLEGIGLNDVLDVYQNAYDQAQAGSR